MCYLYEPRRRTDGHPSQTHPQGGYVEASQVVLQNHLLLLLALTRQWTELLDHFRAPIQHHNHKLH